MLLKQYIFNNYLNIYFECGLGGYWSPCRGIESGKQKFAISLQQVFTKVMNESVVVQDSEILSGTPVFAGTRVPVRNLLDYVEGSYTLDQFLEDFPAVSKTQVITFLEQASAKMLVPA